MDAIAPPTPGCYNDGAVGLALGSYRERINTTSAIVIHLLYNLSLLLLANR